MNSTKDETYETKTYLVLLLGWLTVCVTRVWVGVDNAWEQEKLKARKMLVNRAESHTSGARFVRPALDL